MSFDGGEYEAWIAVARQESAQKRESPELLQAVGAFYFLHLGKGKGESVIDFSKLIRELRLMFKQLPDWKFIMLWVVVFIVAIGYLIGQIRWW